MRKLTRPAAPAELRAYSYPANDWEDVSAAAKQGIWRVLEEMQRHGHAVLCAYCEREIFGNSEGREQRHIEHFWRRGGKHGRPELTFVWSNIFGSCTADRRTCGHYKDRSAGDYNPADLINPCEEDPTVFLTFIANGRVLPKMDLTANERRRAETTIRAFHLNEPGLCRARAGTIERLRKHYGELADEGWDEADIQGYLESAERGYAPFPSARRAAR